MWIPNGTGKTHYLQDDDVQTINQLLRMTDSPSLQSNFVRIYHKVEVNGTVFFVKIIQKLSDEKPYFFVKICLLSSPFYFFRHQI